jgi:RNA polymerase sigma-70 factor (ECF subfamily)
VRFAGKNWQGAAVRLLVRHYRIEEGAMAADDTQQREDLLARARAGQDGALGQLLELYRPYLMLLARLQIGRRLQGKADCADLVQETFLEAARNFAHFRGGSEPELVGWLRQILAGCLAHLVRRYYGTQARDVRLERALQHDLDQSSRALDRSMVAVGSTPSQRASNREQAVLLADALAQLPADYHEVIVLRHLEGLTFPQVAERMGRSVDSVEKLWLRAVTRLRHAVGENP